MTVLLDGRQLPDGLVLRADVAVVGAGPAGLTIAEELAAQGRSVLLIETGGTPRQPRGRDPDLDGHSSGLPFPLSTSRSRGFAGTSQQWRRGTGLRARPLDDIDFGALPARQHAWWPFGRETLEPYYRRAADRVGLPTDAPAQWDDEAPDTQLAWPGGPRLAMFRFARNDVFTGRWDDIVASPFIELLLHATVTRFDVDDTGAVRRLRARSPRGNAVSVQASAYVLACGAIENARLLLSSPGRTGAGLGNETDQLGRWFMDHLSVDTGVATWTMQRRDVPVFTEQRFPDGVNRQPMLWLGPDLIRGHGLLNAAFWLNQVDLSYLSPGVGAARHLRQGLTLTPRLPDAGRRLLTTVRRSDDLFRLAAGRLGLKRTGRGVVMRILAEQSPDARSRIRLSPDRDANGRRRIRLEWRIAPSDLDMVRRHQDVLATQLERRGIGTVLRRFDPAVDDVVMTNHHHIGGTRMHVNEGYGVVDPHCRVHAAPNLWVAGSSVFPTGSYLNPTLTILALSLRIADDVNRELRPVTIAVPEVSAAGAG